MSTFKRSSFGALYMKTHTRALYMKTHTNSNVGVSKFFKEICILFSKDTLKCLN